MQNKKHRDIYLLLSVFALLFILVMIFGASDSAKEKTFHRTDDFKSLAALNQCLFSLARIMAFNDVGVLDAEYERLSEVLNPEEIKNSEVFAAVMETVESLNSLRQEENIRRSNARLNSKKLEKIILERIIQARPDKPEAFTAAMSSVSRNYFIYANYRSGMLGSRGTEARQSWPLGLAEMDSVQKLYQQLLKLCSKLARESNAPEKWQPPADGGSLIEAMRIADPSVRHQAFADLADDYQHLPGYWYYRAATAADANSKFPDRRYAADFRHCLEYYANHREAFANDDYYAGLLIIDLIVNERSADETRSSLALITGGGRDLPSKRLFAALALMRRELYGDAADCLRPNLQGEELAVVSRALATESLAIKNDRAGLWRMLDQVLNDEAVSKQEKLYCLGKISDEIALKKFMAEARDIKILLTRDAAGAEIMLLIMPAGWRLNEAGGTDSRLNLGGQVIAAEQTGPGANGGHIIMFKNSSGQPFPLTDGQARELTVEVGTEYFPLKLKFAVPAARRTVDRRPDRADNSRMEAMIAEAVESLGLEAENKKQPPAGPAPRKGRQVKRPEFILEEISTIGSCWEVGREDSLSPCAS